MGTQSSWKAKFAARKSNKASTGSYYGGSSSSRSTSSGNSSGGGSSNKTTTKTLKVKASPVKTVTASPKSGTVISNGQGYSTMYPESYTKQQTAVNQAKTYYSTRTMPLYGGSGKTLKTKVSASTGKAVQMSGPYVHTNTDTKRNNWYQNTDKFLRGWLPGGITPLESYSNTATDLLTLPQSIYSQYREKVSDIKQDALPVEQNIATLDREIQIAKESQDLYTKNWWEQFGLFQDPMEKQVQADLRDTAYNQVLEPGFSSAITPLSKSNSTSSFIDNANAVGKWALIGIGGLIVYNLTSKRRRK